MHITRLSTTNFRNLVHEPVSFAPGVNLFVGDNGQGKTNILEAMSLFKIGRSFRTSRDNDLIKFEESFCRVETAVEYAAGGDDTYSMSIERRGDKRVKFSGKEIPKLSELVGRYPCVLFGPQDLALSSGAPTERRRFLDMTGSMTDGLYLDDLRSYRRVLTQRNALLKSRGSRSSRRVWDEELVTRGCALIDKRIHLIGALLDHLKQHIDDLDLGYKIDIRYESDLVENIPDGVAREEHFTARLVDLEEEETRRKTTLIGPHRDDIRLILDNRDVRRFGSQGQRRLISVLLRLTELSYMEQKLNEPCVLLLDDLFSELDEQVSERLRNVLENGHQIFVTTPVMMDWGNDGSARVYKIENGRISE